MATRRRQCENKPDAFCYICGCFTLSRQKRNKTSFVRRAYKAYFGFAHGDQDKIWAPHIVCHNFEEMLRDWTKRKRKGLPFGIPMTWREPMDHSTDCLVNTKSIGKKKRHKISYPSIPSSIGPTLHSDQLPIPVFKGFLPSEDVGSDQEQETADETQEILSESGDLSYETPQSLTPQQFSQSELNDLVCDLGLSKNGAEALARLQKKEAAEPYN